MDIYKILENLRRVEEAEVQTNQSKMAAAALQAGIAKHLEMYPALDPQFGIVDRVQEIKPDGTFVMMPRSEPAAMAGVKKLLALGGGANFKVMPGTELAEDEFPGYWTGKMSAKQARGHMVGDGGAAESIEQRLQSKWKQHLEEFGADNTGGTAGNSTTTATANPTDPAANADATVDATNIQKGLNKLKSAGVDLPTGVTQATQTVLKGPGDVQNTQDKQTTMALGNTIADLLQKGDPSSQNQLAAMIQKIEQSRKQQ
jgi:hypothetical protein